MLVGQAVTLISVYYDRSLAEESELRNRVGIMGKIVASSAYRALLDSDFTYLTLIISDILKDQDIPLLTVTDQKGHEYSYAEIGVQLKPSTNFVFSITSRDGNVGSVKIYYTNTSIRHKLYKHLAVLLFMQATVLLSLTLSIRYFFKKNIGDRLTQLVQLLEKVKDGDLTVSSQSQNTSDEISIIANGFDFLIDRLGQTLRKMDAIARNLRDSVAHTDRTVQKVITDAERQQQNRGVSFQSLKGATDSQQGIIAHTTEIKGMARSNSDALETIKGTFEWVVNKTDSLDGEMVALDLSVNELSESSKAVVSLADEAAESVKAITSVLDSVTCSLNKISSTVNESIQQSYQATERITNKGIAAVSNSLETMDSIMSIFQLLSNTIVRLDDRSKHIKKVLSVITEVTTNVKLLSLNASIIASQAGEKGKSFGVVANEMKLLATKTSQSTNEIEEIIKVIQNEIRSAVEETKETSLIIQKGNSVATMTGEVIDEIMEMSSYSTEMIQNIAITTGEQNVMINSVFEDVKQLQAMNLQVRIAAAEEEKSSTFVRNSVSSICTLMRETRQMTNDQHCSLKIISENIQSTNTQIEDIADASSEQQKVNHDVIGSITASIEDGIDMVSSVKDVAASINGVHKEVELLRQEMSYFRID